MSDLMACLEGVTQGSVLLVCYYFFRSRGSVITIESQKETVL
jgi:hypothetical protein